MLIATSAFFLNWAARKYYYTEDNDPPPPPPEVSNSLELVEKVEIYIFDSDLFLYTKNL